MRKKKVEQEEVFVPETSEPVASPEQPARTFFAARISRRRAKRIALLLIIVVVLLVLARVFHLGGWGLSPEEKAQREVAAFVQEVSALMLLPEETPVVATVTDAEALKAEQPFYQHSENGDVLLVFSAAQRAVLYRPSAKRIINVGPIYLNQETTPEPALPAPVAAEEVEVIELDISPEEETVELNIDEDTPEA